MQRAKHGGAYWRYTASDGNFSYSGPAVENGIVYAGGTDGKMYALDAATGDLLWTCQGKEAIESGPAIKNGIVYLEATMIIYMQLML